MHEHSCAAMLCSYHPVFALHTFCTNAVEGVLECCYHLFAAEDDLHDVLREVVDIKNIYYQLGVGFHLSPRELDAIRNKFPDVDQAFTEVLLVWLRQSYNVERYGTPTWRRLVEAVDSPAGGNNHTLAKSIASHHPTGNLTLLHKGHSYKILSLACELADIL